jgi:AraC-like DNA-binding protein
MPFAPQIRKQILLALNQHIIPALQTRIVPQVLLGPPFDFSGLEHRTLRELPLVNRRLKPLDVLVRWKKECLAARRMSQLSFIYGGVSEECVGITRQMAQDLKSAGQTVPPGVTGVRLSAPTIFYVPPHIPHSDIVPHDPPQMLVIQPNERDLFLRLTGSHVLHVFEPPLIQQENAYVETLRSGDSKIAQMRLLDFAQHLSEYLSSHRATVANSAWPVFNEKSFHQNKISEEKIQLFYKAIDYIQFHLHTSLTTHAIAGVCGVSYVHLNRVFQEISGVSLMHFVTQTRLNAAKQMLSSPIERISDIARLVGFSSANTFSTVFARSTGMSPRKYRQQNAIDKSHQH